MPSLEEFKAPLIAVGYGPDDVDAFLEQCMVFGTEQAARCAIMAAVLEKVDTDPTYFDAELLAKYMTEVVEFDIDDEEALAILRDVDNYGVFGWKCTRESKKGGPGFRFRRDSKEVAPSMIPGLTPLVIAVAPKVIDKRAKRAADEHEELVRVHKETKKEVARLKRQIQRKAKDDERRKRSERRKELSDKGKRSDIDRSYR